MKSVKAVRVAAVLIALLALSHPVVTLVCDLGAYASPAAVGAAINAATGNVDAVADRSDAAAAGLRAGDRVDFARTGPLMHLWLWDGLFPVGKPVTLPVIRDRQPTVVRIVATPPPLDTRALTVDVIAVLFALVVLTLACVAVFARVDPLTVALYAFCASYAASYNTAWLQISPPALMPLTALESVLPPLGGTFGFVFLCLRYPTGSPQARWRAVDRAMLPLAAVLSLIYYLHFYESTFVAGKTFSLYEATGVLTVLVTLVGFVAYLTRF